MTKTTNGCLGLFIAFITLTVALFSLSACSNHKTNVTTLHYSAAASLQGSLTKIGTDYEKAHPDVKIEFDFSGSGSIRQQVLSGAPIDGVFLASKSDTDKLTSAHKANSPVLTLSNQLVLIAPKDSSLQGNDIAHLINSAHKIAIGEPSSVPAGMYAKESLSKLNLYTDNQSKLVMGSSVTQTLSYVASRNANLGFVYHTDALTNSNVKIISPVADNLHDKIAYYTATVSNSKYPSQVENFNQYLSESTAQNIFESYGFIKP